MSQTVAHKYAVSEPTVSNTSPLSRMSRSNTNLSFAAFPQGASSAAVNGYLALGQSPHDRAQFSSPSYAISTHENNAYNYQALPYESTSMIQSPYPAQPFWHTGLPTQAPYVYNNSTWLNIQPVRGENSASTPYVGYQPIAPPFFESHYAGEYCGPSPTDGRFSFNYQYPSVIAL
jgi:hypothetical protein